MSVCWVESGGGGGGGGVTRLTPHTYIYMK